MHAISSSVDRLAFAATCVIGWLIFPLIIAAGFFGLLVYAVVAESISIFFPTPTRDAAGRDTAPRNTLSARRPRLRGHLYP